MGTDIHHWLNCKLVTNFLEDNLAISTKTLNLHIL